MYIYIYIYIYIYTYIHIYTKNLSVENAGNEKRDLFRLLSKSKKVESHQKKVLF